jgi:hypothetical protein
VTSFDGFGEHDFHELRGSSWRGREALGGLLADALRADMGDDCRSWGVRRRLELHIARRNHYNFADPWPYAKLFVYTTGELAYGFYVEAPETGKDDGKFSHWRNFRDRLQADKGLQQALSKTMEEHHLTMADYYRWRESGGALRGQFRAHHGQLQWSPSGEPNWQGSTFDQLVERVSRLDGEHWIDLHIFARMDKDTAIGMGREVVEALLTVLRSLVPVYHAATASRPT